MTLSQWAFALGACGGLQGLDVLGLEDGVEALGVFGVAVSDEEPQRLEVDAEVAGRFLACWVAQAAVGWAVTPAMMASPGR